MLVELPQTIKQKIWRLRSFRKWQNKKFSACGASANGKTKNWRLRSFRKWQNKKIGACGASANGKTKKLALAELPQTSKQKI